MTERARTKVNAAGATRRLHSEMSHSTPDSITVRGYDLPGDLMGKVNVGEMAFLELMGRLPDEGESVLFNAMLVSLVEHGITPNTIAARLTFLGAPEALQGAVAAGLLGLGTVFVGTIEGSARILQEALPGASADADLGALAREIVSDFRQRRAAIPGLGHPLHRPIDPRTTRLFTLADEYGYTGRYVELMQTIGREAEAHTGRVLPVNVTGAIGAVCSELSIPWQICRGLGVMARAVGLVGHLLEEMREPMGAEIWRRVEEEAQSG